jgi:Asp-tRNA(Asn)/Glu-tRNA(Gln) amidotransferase A subunit family amidase
MKNIRTTAKGIFILLIAVSCSESDSRISRGDINGAEKVAGIEFERWEKDTMQNYLNRNLKGYDSMRTYQLQYSTEPALYFDPVPSFYSINTDQRSINWPESEAKLPEAMKDISFFTIPELSSLLKSGQISSVELTEFYLDRLKTYGDTLEAVINLTEELAITQARKMDKELATGKYRGPLHGIPYGIKDLFSVPGYPTTWGANPYRDQVIDDQATIVKKLEDAGAVLVAKLTSGALARGDVWFDGKTRNPWDLEQGASGSSAGSASAVAAGLVPFAIGTETLGSIVSPSTRCGVTGIRPTFGRVSRYGAMSLSWSMDKVGPIAGSAMDCAIVLDAIRGVDPKDKSTRTAAFNFDLGKPLSEYKIGYFKSLFDNDSSDSGENNKEVLQKWVDLNVSLEEVEFPSNFPFNAFDIILRSEAGAFFDDLVHSHGDRELVEQTTGSRANSLRQSRFIPAVEYIQANRHRNVLIEEFNRLLMDYDAILSPTFGGRQLLVTNLTGHPAISIPTGFDDEDHPTSITIIGNLFEENKILELAHIFQENTEYHLEHPDWVQ